MDLGDKYEVRGNELWRAEWPSREFKLSGIYPSSAQAEQEKADREASDRIFAGSQNGRAAWQQLLRIAFPDAKLCNCGDALYGCKYGCEWNQNRTKEAVAVELLKKLT